MNNSEATTSFKPHQALSPTPQLYDELVGDCMENLAKATVAEMLPISPGSVILDAGCGTGAGTTAIMDTVSNDSELQLSIKGVDVNEDALEFYKKKAKDQQWPVEPIRTDAGKLENIEESTFTHAIGTAFLFVLPEDGVPAIKEIYRTLKPGGIAAFNSWAYVPNMDPIRAASSLTRPQGTSEVRASLDKWENVDFLRSTIEKGGFASDRIQLIKRDIYVLTAKIDRYAAMLWSFIGGTTAAGWLESDEEKWDEAIEIVKTELRQTDGYKELEDGRLQLKFVANIAVATK